MSTSITNGYNFGKQDVFALSSTIRQLFRPVLLEIIHSHPVANAVEMYDKLQSGNEILVREVYRAAKALSIDSERLTWFDLYRIAVDKDRKDDFWDAQKEHNLEVVFLCDEQTENIFVMVYGSREARDHFDDVYSDFEYPYWNNSDRPKELSEAEWEERKVTWGRLLGHNSPQVSGLSMTVMESYEIAPRLAYYEAGNSFRLPDMESRVRVLARNIVAAEFVVPEQDKDKPFDMSLFMEHMSIERITDKMNLIEGTLDDTFDVESMRASLERPWLKDRKKTV
jgi:hypothetical protein